MQINRTISEEFYQSLEGREIVILYGARKIGKTSFLKRFIEESPLSATYLNCENPYVEDALAKKNLHIIKALFGKYKYICLDEAQRVEDIGSVLNLIYEELCDYKIIATGSSSFELANKIQEPLIGKHRTLRMNPLTLKEINKCEAWLDIQMKFQLTMVFGMYPEVYALEQTEKRGKLTELASDLLFKDILKHLDIRQSNLFRKILKAVAFNIGTELSTNHLASELSVSRPTIERYLYLLEKSFIIFSLDSYKRKLGNELKKSKKYYFFDNGLRNAIINNFNLIDNRSDGAQLWENFCVSEIMKQQQTDREIKEFYFWRTYDQAEIDLVQEKQDKVNIWDFKWKPRRKPKFPNSFMATYVIGCQELITPKELHTFLN